MGEPAGGGYCIPTLGAVCPIESAWGSFALFRSVLYIRTTLDSCQQGDGGVTGMLAMTGLPRPRWQHGTYVFVSTPPPITSHNPVPDWLMGMQRRGTSGGIHLLGACPSVFEHAPPLFGVFLNDYSIIPMIGSFAYPNARLKLDRSVFRRQSHP